MAGVDVCADGDEEMLIELKGTWELLRQLPHTLQELIDDRRLLLRIAVQVSIPAVRLEGKFRLTLRFTHKENQISRKRNFKE